MMEHGSCNIYRTSHTVAEYRKISRTLTGSNKMSDIEPDLINKTLMEQACDKLKESTEVFLIHDPSDIRKPYSSDAENLGNVRDLNGKIINGYSTHNVIAVTPNNKSITLLSHKSYSNKDPLFLKQATIKQIKEGKSFEGDVEAKTLYESGEYFNKKTLTIVELTRVSQELKKANPLFRCETGKGEAEVE